MSDDSALSGVSDEQMHGNETDNDKRRLDNINECAVCLQPFSLPVQIPCGHIFCFLCIKGVGARSLRCPLCRQAIPSGYFHDPKILSEIGRISVSTVSSELSVSSTGETKEKPSEEMTIAEFSDVPKTEDATSTSTSALSAIWLYEGHNGWWRYDDRTSEILEEAFTRNSDNSAIETLISGYVYVVDFRLMVQYRKDEPSRRRRVKRESLNDNQRVTHSVIKGVAGLKLASAALTKDN